MRRSSTIALVALLLAGAACSPAKGGSFRPTGGDPGPVGASPSTAGEAGEFPFAPDLHVVFESPVPPDATRARVYADFRFLFAAYYYAGQTQGRDHRYEDRLLGDQRSVFMGTLTRLVKRHRAPWGTIRFFRTEVSAIYGRGAAVDTCVDETRFGMKDARTGRPDPGSVPGRRKAMYQIRAGLQRGEDGIWRLISYETHKLPDSMAKGCQR